MTDTVKQITKKQIPETISLRSPKCPRRRTIALLTDRGEQLAIQTKCKTWGCQVCRQYNLERVMRKMTYGCSTAKHSYFITVTYKVEPVPTRTADSVNRDYRELLRILPYPRSQIRWFKVTELTKVGTPHLHLLVNGIGEAKANCLGPVHPWREEWLANTTCMCVEHVWSRAWHRVTKDSYITAARHINFPDGTAHYLTKYFTKAYEHRYDLMALGFGKRYSTSRNWPDPQFEMAGKGKFERSEMMDGPVGERYYQENRRYSETHPYLRPDHEDDKQIERWYDLKEAQNVKLLAKLRGAVGLPGKERK